VTAVLWGIAGVCYFCVSIAGFYAFGTAVPEATSSAAFVEGDQTRWGSGSRKPHGRYSRRRRLSGESLTD